MFPLEGGQGQDNPGNVAPTNDGAPNVNPAWNDVLADIPPELHSKVTPHFQKWDQNFQQVQQKYSPYQEFATNGVTPDQIRQAMSVSQAIETNPRGVYDVLRQHFGEEKANEMMNENTQTGPSGGNEDWQSQIPAPFLDQFNQLKSGYETMAQILLAKQQEEQQKAEDGKVAEIFNWVENNSPVYKELNAGEKKAAEPYLNSLLAAGVKPEKALEMFHSFVDQVGVYHNRPKPVIPMSGNGRMIPSGGPDIKSMGDQDVRNLIAKQLEVIKHANQ